MNKIKYFVCQNYVLRFYMSSYAIYPSLQNKVVFITGGATGIGASIVEHFSMQGAKVHFCDINVDAGEELCGALGGQVNHTPTFHHCDLREISVLQNTIQKVGEAEKRIDILVNNAAHDERHEFEKITTDYFDDRIAVNLKHQLFAAQAAATFMKAQKSGCIINLGSITYMVGQGGMACYSASKAAIWGLTRSLAKDLGEYNIRVNMVVPGWIITERQKLWLNEESEKELLKSQVIKRKLVPEDVARVVLFYSADDSSACSAQSYMVDGGWL